jgi:two-component system, sensor histidine kinase and response regulator
VTKPDVARALQRLGISEEIYNELIVDFLVMAREKASELEKAVAAANLEEAAKLAHSIKGSAANLGIDAVADIARVIESESAKGILTQEITDGMKALALCINAFSS